MIKAMSRLGAVKKVVADEAESTITVPAAPAGETVSRLYRKWSSQRTR